MSVKVVGVRSRHLGQERFVLGVDAEFVGARQVERDEVDGMPVSPDRSPYRVTTAPIWTWRYP